VTDRFVVAYFNFLAMDKYRDAAAGCVNAIILKKMKAEKKVALIQALNLNQVFNNVDVTVRVFFLHWNSRRRWQLILFFSFFSSLLFCTLIRNTRKIWQPL